MALSFIQLPADGTGKKAASETWTQGLDEVHGQKLLICNASGTVIGVGDAANGLDVDVTRLPSLPFGTNRLGGVHSLAVWHNDTVTALAAAGTFTGTARDATAVGSGAYTSSGFPNEARGLAISDVAGTLHLEVSRDNVTWRRIDSVATAAKASGLHVAEALYKPATRYFRWVYVNGSAAQAHFELQTMMV